MVKHSITFPTILYGCVAGTKIAHANGITVSYTPRVRGDFVDIESINTQGSETTHCRIPLPADPKAINDFADALRDIAKHITNGTA